jgi:putative tryptophan/tyrosine transport system substrate-binding protein
MRRKVIGLTLGAMLFALCTSAEAQQPTKMAKIGFLTGGGHDSARNEAFRQGLRELGYVDGRTSLLSGELQRDNLVASPRWRLS